MLGQNRVLLEQFDSDFNLGPYSFFNCFNQVPEETSDEKLESGA